MIETIIGWTATAVATAGIVLGVTLIALTLKQSRRNNVELKQLHKHKIVDPAAAAKAAEEVLAVARRAAEELAANERAKAGRNSDKGN